MSERSGPRPLDDDRLGQVLAARAAIVRAGLATWSEAHSLDHDTLFALADEVRSEATA